MEREQFGEESRSAMVPRNEGRNWASFEDGDHIPHSVRILRVILQHIQKPRVNPGVKHAFTGVVAQHALVPEYVDEISDRRRRRRSRSFS